jgi:phosphatidate cytidylyltransferase
MMESQKLDIGGGVVSLASVFYVWGLYFLVKTGRPWAIFDAGFITLVAAALFAVYMSRIRNLGGNGRLVKSLSVNLFAFLYLTWFPAFFLKVLYYPNVDGRGFMLFALLVAKGTDIFSYVFGKKFGKRKMAPLLSPNKTLEGAAGGILSAVVLAGLCHLVFMGSVISFPKTLFLGLTIPAVSIFGDLAESAVKRDTGYKDTGVLLPGLGGGFDLLDSMIFVAPWTFLAMSLWVC